jgi:hypothetical protein
VDAADRHLLVYGYNDFHRMTVMNLSTGHLASITVVSTPATLRDLAV